MPSGDISAAFFVFGTKPTRQRRWSASESQRLDFDSCREMELNWLWLSEMSRLRQIECSLFPLTRCKFRQRSACSRDKVPSGTSTREGEHSSHRVGRIAGPVFCPGRSASMWYRKDLVVINPIRQPELESWRELLLRQSPDEGKRWGAFE